MAGKIENKTLILNADLRGRKKGSHVRVRTRDGIPNDPYWRRRLDDAMIDGCVEFMETKKIKKIKKTKEEEK